MPLDPPIVRPPGFPHSLGPLTTPGHCIACYALHFASTDSLFRPYCKKGIAMLLPIRELPRKLYTLLTGNDPRCRSFRTNIHSFKICALERVTVPELGLEFSTGDSIDFFESRKYKWCLLQLFNSNEQAPKQRLF